MKNFLIIFCGILLAISCSRKTIPPKTNAVIENNVTENKIGENNNKDNINTDTTKTTVSNSSTIVMVVADSYGRLITPKANLPQDASIIYNSLRLSRGLTVQQRANLEARYNMLPPRVLFIPEQLELNSLKGKYYIYMKKFWYWKNQDGLFYLDQKYYL
ncbi:MAG: hypothetical protein JST21_04900 [Bacteroidetes bacterium]|nr:hypothetical protein [Bacteroidota bacterium]